MKMKDKKENIEQNPEESENNVDQIRDILFGKHIKEFDKRFSRVEENLNNQIQTLKDDTKKMFENLEVYIKSEIKSLSDKLKTEQSKRSDADTELENEKNRLEKRYTEFEESVNAFEREIRDQLLDQGKRFTENMTEQRQEIMNEMKKVTSELHHTKVDRNTLASFLNDIALKISGEEE
jgi:Skp family chaperone for outer membrane proteins